MRTVHLIHGFNERHKVQQPRLCVLIDDIKKRKLNYMVHDYGHWDLVATRNNANIARLIYPHVKPGDTLVGFSNGAAIIAHLLRLGVEVDKLVLIQPALSKKWTPPVSVSQVTVFYNEGDLATIAGKWWRRATGFLPWRWQDRHNWGEMGHTGYTGKDERFFQYKTDNASVAHHASAPEVSGHGSWTHKKNAAWWKVMVSHM